jgi:hypothetical protein
LSLNLIFNAAASIYRGTTGRRGEGRQDEWTGSIAVGSKFFIENVKARLGFRAKGREVIKSAQGYQLRENSAVYKTLFEVENEDIDLKNTYFGDLKSE